MKNIKPNPEKEKKTKIVTIRMAPTVHVLLKKKAKDKKISLARLMIESALAISSVD